MRTPTLNAAATQETISNVAPVSNLEAALAVRADIDRLLARETWCHQLVPHINLNWGAMLGDTGRIVRRLRGRVMPTWLAYETETSAALQFPEYYETYPNAFDEWLSYLDWLTTDTGFLLFVTHPEPDARASGPSTIPT